jgi:hypothetical protein
MRKNTSPSDRTCAENSTLAAFAVQDTGPGIDPTQIERIFDVFVTTNAGAIPEARGDSPAGRVASASRSAAK